MRACVYEYVYMYVCTRVFSYSTDTVIICVDIRDNFQFSSSHLSKRVI